MTYYLSYLMGARNIEDSELGSLGITIDKTSEGDRMLKVPQDSLSKYVDLIKEKLDEGFWNEIIGSEEIRFIFKFNDGAIKVLTLSLDTESKIDKLCSEFNNEPPEKTANIYKYLSENEFYHDFMIEHYSNLIRRRQASF